MKIVQAHQYLIFGIRRKYLVIRMTASRPMTPKTVIISLHNGPSILVKIRAYMHMPHMIQMVRCRIIL
jgi:hypothetical protein